MSDRSDFELQRRRRLIRLLSASPLLRAILTKAPLLGLPNWYVGAGCIAGTVWNDLHGFSDGSHIKDCDLVYYDASDTSYEAEDSRIRAATALLSEIPIPVELRNQARVHLWYERRFGRAIEPYGSVEDAIQNWPTTATSIGVRTEDGGMLIHAPFGLDDLFDMIVRPNKRQVTRDVYEEKAARWSACWPRLRVIPWVA